MTDKKKVEIFTDGACSGNPGPGGWGTILRYKTFEKELSGYEAATTNNRMELTAVVEGLHALKEPCHVTVYTDSQYLKDGITSWIKKWKRNRQEGQLSSVLAGLAVADRPGVDGVLVHLVDTPLVRPETVHAVLDAFQRTRAPIVRPEVGGRHGHPVLFARSVFDDLRRADPAIGARAVVQAHAAEVCDVAVDDEGACRDIDTPEDFARLPGSRPADQRGDVGRLAVHEQPDPEHPRRKP